MKKLFNKIKNKVVSMVKNVARRILKNEIAFICDDKVVANHEMVGAREELLKVLADKKATKAMMIEAMRKALVHIDEALGK